MNYNEQNLNIPDHIAIILDGNGTWAKKRLMPRLYGHKQGSKALVDIVRYANDINVKYLTVYCFSTENWNRPIDEVNYLMKLLKIMLRTYKNDLVKNNIRFRVIGTKEHLSNEQIKMINNLEEDTKNCTGLNFTAAFNYGSHEEIIHAIKNMINDNVKASDVNSDLVNKYLYTKDLPPVDLMIRTSNQIRISNFLLWQIAYSELYFIDTLWPDFKRADLDKAILEFNKRDRRFGGIKK